MNPMPYGQNGIQPVTSPWQRRILEERKPVQPNDWFTKDQLALQQAKAAHRIREARREVRDSKPIGRYFA